MLRNEVLSDRFQSSAVFVADPARKRAGHSLTELAVASIALIAIGGHGALHAETSTANIVGLGATTCSTFNHDVQQDFRIQRDYFAWAQGFMSGILVRGPPGRDEGLELIPSGFSMQKQVEFLRTYCAENPDKDYSDGVVELYRTLRGEHKS